MLFFCYVYKKKNSLYSGHIDNYLSFNKSCITVKLNKLLALCLYDEDFPFPKQSSRRFW